MSLLFGRAESRSISTADFGWSDDMTPMGAQSALYVVPAYAAIKIISEAIASLPVHQYSDRNGVKAAVPLCRAIDSPADGSFRFDWMQRLVTSLLTNHGAVGVLSGFDMGWPTGCTWVNPSRLTGEMVGGSPRYWLDGKPISDRELLYIPSMAVPGQALGVSPVRHFAETFSAAREAQRANRAWSKSRAVPGSTLQNTKQTLDQKTAEVLADRALARIQNGKPFVYGSDWKFDVLSLPAGDLAFLESIKANATQIAAIYNIAPQRIGGNVGDSLTYATVEGNQLRFLTDTIQPWLAKIEEPLSRRLMPRPQYLKFNADAVVRIDTNTRIALYRAYREIGMHNVDELLALDDQPPLPNGQGQSYAPLALIQKGTADEGR